MFEEIGRRLPPPDLSAIPIGAYDPRYIMDAQHCDPEEAVQIHKVLVFACAQSLGWACEGCKGGAAW